MILDFKIGVMVFFSESVVSSGWQAQKETLDALLAEQDAYWLLMPLFNDEESFPSPLQWIVSYSYVDSTNARPHHCIQGIFLRRRTLV